MTLHTESGLSCEGLSKSFGGVPVLRDVTVDFEPGTVNVLAGENGAGKSTLMKIVAGLLRPDAGRVRVNGSRLSKFDPAHARAAGVSFIPQELAPLPHMRVDENLLLGRAPRRPFGMIDRKAMATQAHELLAPFGLDVDPRAPMGQMSVAVTQLIEIAKHTGWDSTVMLMDEPTASISEREIERLFSVIDRLREQGVCVVYTTHKMEEIATVADTVSVLRDGRLVTRGPSAEFTQDAIVQAMIGREVGNLFPERPTPSTAEPELTVRDLWVTGATEPIDLDVRPGEIVGLAGLVGAGRTELLESIFGARKAQGSVRVSGRDVRLGMPSAAIASGMAMVPEDRKNAGLVLEMTVANNTTLPHIRQFLTGGWFVDRGAQARGVRTASERVNLRGRPRQLARHLSGGNQQKVVLSRWLLGNMRVLLLDEPTRGVDVGARAEIYRIITDLADSGVAVLLASSELDEVVNLAHRVLVMRGQRVASDIERDDQPDAALKEQILRSAMGLSAPESTADHPTNRHPGNQHPGNQHEADV